MRRATVTLTNEDTAALGIEENVAPFREAGLVDVQVVSCRGRRGGVVRVSVEREVDEDRLDALDSVEWWERVAGSEPEVAYLVGFSAPDAPQEGDDTGNLPLTEEVVVHEDGFSFDLMGPHDAISELLADYRDAGAEVTLHAIQEYRADERPLDALTSRQSEVLRAAYEMGYYDVPRSASTEELAAELDLDASTVSEHLQRAEQNLLSTVLGESP